MTNTIPYEVYVCDINYIIDLIHSNYDSVVVKEHVKFIDLMVSQSTYIVNIIIFILDRELTKLYLNFGRFFSRKKTRINSENLAKSIEGLLRNSLGERISPLIEWLSTE